MAQHTVTVLTDDIDGTEIKDGGETITFSIDGTTYEIDLNDKNAKKMREAFAFYTDHGRKKPKSESTVQKARAASNRDYDPKAVRTWAQEAMVKVPDRGRIPAEVVIQFKKATEK
jgi:hypothetical protein